MEAELVGGDFGAVVEAMSAYGAAGAAGGIGDAVAVFIHADTERRPVFGHVRFVPAELDESGEGSAQVLLPARGDDAARRHNRLHTHEHQKADQAHQDHDQADGEDPQMIGAARRHPGCRHRPYPSTKGKAHGTPPVGLGFLLTTHHSTIHLALATAFWR